MFGSLISLCYLYSRKLKEKTTMEKFTLFWLDGKSEIVEGDDIASAVNGAGYGYGALGALDFYANGDETTKWEWNKENKSWKSV